MEDMTRIGGMLLVLLRLTAEEYQVDFRLLPNLCDYMFVLVYVMMVCLNLLIVCIRKAIYRLIFADSEVVACALDDNDDLLCLNDCNEEPHSAQAHTEKSIEYEPLAVSKCENADAAVWPYALIAVLALMVCVLVFVVLSQSGKIKKMAAECGAVEEDRKCEIEMEAHMVTSTVN